MTHKLSICLPNFPGFYPSWLDQELDHLADREVEWMVEKQSDQTYHPEHYQPEELRLDEGEFHEILFDVADHSAMHFAVAKTYADAFNHWFGEWSEDSLGPDGRIELGAEYEEMTSPRFYNFETDRLFILVEPAAVMRLLQVNAEHDSFLTLAQAIRERHTSRSGFISHYTNAVEEWFERDVTEWDHNELGTLLLAAMRCMGINQEDNGEPSGEAFMWLMIDGDGLFQEFQDGVDWDKLDQKVRELREEKEAEAKADDPDWEPPYRCPETGDLFAPFTPTP